MKKYLILLLLTLGGVKVTLAAYTYDKLGRLQSKSPHGASANKLTYDYNIRDWLTGISGTRFTQNLYYNTGAGTARYNGNISCLTWKAGTESTVRGYKFAYDPNGNLTKDLNKGISNILYNFLNLPSIVTFSDGSTITYTYAADDTKLRTVHKVADTSTTTDYCGNVIYENGVQKLMLTGEGYVTLSDNKYHYYLQDHLGNNRVVINQSGTVEETNHYYPFGGIFASTANIQPYKYNGKELDKRKGLNWYDYGAKNYDAALGRFHTNDRFAEKYYSLSPYQYGANNPIRNIDVNGDTIVIDPNPNGLADEVRMFLGFDTKYQRQVKADLEQLKSEDADVAKMIIELETSVYSHNITMPNKESKYVNATKYDKKKVNNNIPQGSIVYYNPYSQKRSVTDKETRTPRIGLVHELQHSFDLDKGFATEERISNGIKIMDIRAVNKENRIRKILGEPKRIMYGDEKIPEDLLE